MEVSAEAGNGQISGDPKRAETTHAGGGTFGRGAHGAKHGSLVVHDDARIVHIVHIWSLLVVDPIPEFRGIQPLHHPAMDVSLAGCAEDDAQ